MSQRCPFEEFVVEAIFEGGMDNLPEAVEEHISKCPICAELANGASIAVAAFRDVGAIEPPGSLGEEAENLCSATLRTLLDGAPYGSAAQALEHASSCEVCTEALSLASELRGLAEQIAPPEELLAACRNLPQQKPLRPIRGEGAPSSGVSTLGAAAALVASILSAAAACFIFFAGIPNPTPDTLVGQAKKLASAVLKEGEARSAGVMGRVREFGASTLSTLKPLEKVSDLKRPVASATEAVAQPLARLRTMPPFSMLEERNGKRSEEREARGNGP